MNVNQARNDGTTPLFIAAQEGHLKVVQQLLAKEGIEVNAATNAGYITLLVAARKGHSNIGAILLIHGANLDSVNSEFYKQAIDHIAHEIINYDKYKERKLAFLMGSHKRLGGESILSDIAGDMMRLITELAVPPKIELDKMQEKHRAAVQERIKKLRQEEIQQTKDTPGNSVGADGVTAAISPRSLQL
ncbi:ankyrin repeat domain-containing protein [Rickettsiales bacterium]|nr:ankyrin repeat domain-containing protein [Rickettsiales bacterium]